MAKCGPVLMAKGGILLTADILQMAVAISVLPVRCVNVAITVRIAGVETDIHS